MQHGSVGDRVSVWALGDSEPFQTMVAELGKRPEFQVVAPEDRDAADIVVVLATSLTDELLAELDGIIARSSWESCPSVWCARIASLPVATLSAS